MRGFSKRLRLHQKRLRVRLGGASLARRAAKHACMRLCIMHVAVVVTGVGVGVGAALPLLPRHHVRDWQANRFDVMRLLRLPVTMCTCIPCRRTCVHGSCRCGLWPSVGGPTSCYGQATAAAAGYGSHQLCARPTRRDRYAAQCSLGTPGVCVCSPRPAYIVGQMLPCSTASWTS